MSATYYRAIAATLERVAEDVSDCEASTVSPCSTRLPDVLQGAATSFLAARVDDCAGELRTAAAILRNAADDALRQAMEIDEAVAEAAETIVDPTDGPPIEAT